MEIKFIDEHRKIFHDLRAAAAAVVGIVAAAADDDVQMKNDADRVANSKCALSDRN